MVADSATEELSALVVYVRYNVMLELLLTSMIAMWRTSEEKKKNKEMALAVHFSSALSVKCRLET